MSETQGAWGAGLATIAGATVLDTWYPEPRLGADAPAEGAQGGLHGVGQRPLGPRHRWRVHESPRQREDVAGEIEGRQGGHDCRA